jgi:hypothetical protein
MLPANTCGGTAAITESGTGEGSRKDAAVGRTISSGDDASFAAMLTTGDVSGEQTFEEEVVSAAIPLTSETVSVFAPLDMLKDS